MKFSRRAMSLALLALAATCSPARAQIELPQGAAGIAVSGIGAIKARPDLVRIDVRVQGKAEVTEDALVKYRDSRRRLSEALHGLKLKNLRLTETSVGLSSGGGQANIQAMMNGMPSQNDTAQPTEITGNLQIAIGDLAEVSPEDLLKLIGKVIDATKDAGGSLGPSAAEMNMAWRYGRMPAGTTVRFVLRDLTRAREQAYEQAVRDARSRAERLARLNDVKLGRVTSLQELQVAGDNPEVHQRNVYNPWGGEDSGATPERDEIVNDSLADITVNVRLMVRFQIESPNAQPVAGAESK
jgi:uncharacterized protein